ncbi:MAG: outer membrane protein assembly factor BamB family protein [Planctomycetota bacterium]|jgi:outer membrane protein assembly factor BamB
MIDPRPQSSTDRRALADLVFIGLSRRVLAVDRYTGDIVWEWKSPKGGGFVSVLLDGDRLIVAASGYLYCLDPMYGQVVWENPLKGKGQGVASLVSVNGAALSAQAAAVIAQQQAAAAAAAGGAA